MKRLAQASLSAWYSRSDRKPLVVRGARQVGKSTLIRQVAAELSIPLWEINLERHLQLEGVFSGFDIALILREIGFAIGAEDVGVGPGILFLDEIQSTPSAISALRYFFEDRPDIAVIGAGSLLEITLAKANLSMPVGRVEYHYLGPMTFFEFLEARDDIQLRNYLQEYDFSEPFSSTMHDRGLVQLRDYLLSGGMPEAVKALCTTGEWSRISPIHHSILDTYAEDFGKYASGAELIRLQRIFSRIPSLLGKKFKYVNIDSAWRSTDVRHALDLLVRAGVVCQVFHSDATGLPLGANENVDIFKPLFLDVGLVNAACGLKDLPINRIRDTRFVNEGAMAEQFIGQHLLHAGESWERPALHYWLREGKSANAEVDYCLAMQGEILPVEVKSGTSGSLRSLHQFVAARSCSRAIRFDCNPPSSTR